MGLLRMLLPLALVMGADLCHGDEIAACHEAEKTRDESAAVAAACARACELKDGYGCMAAWLPAFFTARESRCPGILPGPMNFSRPAAIWQTG